MKFLVLAPFLPYPEDVGMKIKLAKLLPSLGRENTFLLAFKNEKEEIAEEKLKALCAEYFVFPRPKITQWSIFKNYFSFKPLLINRFFSEEAAATVAKVVREKEIDIVLFESLLMARYLPFVQKKITILHAHNIESIRARRRIKNAPYFWQKIYSALIAWRLHRYEKKILNKFTYLFACSEQDRCLLEKMIGQKKIFVLPNIVDTAYFKPVEQSYDPYLLVFLGTLWYHPNEEAALFLLEKIFPHLKESFPSIKLEIIGEGASPKLIMLAEKWDKDVKIWGRLEDIRPHLARAGALIAPILSGSGTRTKILTAMAMGLPVISTSLGCEGLDVKDDREILLAHSPEELKNKLELLLTDEKKRQQLAKNGRAYVEANHSPQVLKKRLEAICQEIEKTHFFHSSSQETNLPVKNENLKLSLIIVNWNTAHYLRPCLQSILSTIFNLTYEIIVVDNASTDGSAEMIKKEFPSVHLIKNESNLGFARACNQGWRLARGKYVLFLNPDTLLQPGTVEEAIKIMEIEKKIGLLGIRNLNQYGQPRRSAYDLPSPLRIFAFITGLNRLLPPSRLRKEDKRKTTAYVPGSFLLARAEVLKELGGYDENFFMYGEDVDICLRAWQKGWQVVYEPNLTIIHFESGSRHQLWPIIHDYINSLLYFYRRHFSPKETQKIKNAIKIALIFLWIKALIKLFFSPGSFNQESKKIKSLLNELSSEKSRQ